MNYEEQQEYQEKMGSPEMEYLQYLSEHPELQVTKGESFECLQHGLDYRIACDDCQEKYANFSSLVRRQLTKLGGIKGYDVSEKRKLIEEIEKLYGKDFGCSIEVAIAYLSKRGYNSLARFLREK